MSEHPSVTLATASELFSPVVELRQYTLHPGRRDELIDLFDTHLVGTQEATGMKVIAQFRDLDRPDHFVWLRGFEDMAARKVALETFYGGPVWAAHKEAANATMIDSDDVLLLKPAWPASGFDLSGKVRDLPGKAQAETLITATICHITPASEAEFIALFESETIPLLARLGAPLLAGFVTEHAENTFPRLPVRSSENVFIAFQIFESAKAHALYEAALNSDPSWADSLLPRLLGHFSGPVQRLRLVPTERSLL